MLLEPIKTELGDRKSRPNIYFFIKHLEMKKLVNIRQVIVSFDFGTVRFCMRLTMHAQPLRMTTSDF